MGKNGNTNTGVHRMRAARKFAGFVIQNEATGLYWCGKHTWVSTMTRARHFEFEGGANDKTVTIRVQENNLGMALKVLNIGEVL